MSNAGAAFTWPTDFRADAAPDAYANGLRAIAAGQTQFDLSGVVTCDSTLVAAVLGWKRAAAARSTTIKFVNTPAGFGKLASLYGVDHLTH
jgi:phospholipid transport system transporter-binding protein